MPTQRRGNCRIGIIDGHQAPSPPRDPIQLGDLWACTELQWFAFVYLPVGVTIFGALFALVGVQLIERADCRKPRAAE